MNTMRTLFAAIGCLLFLLSVSHAQVPNIISYQGRVTVDGADFNGTGHFKFAFVNAAGTTSFWSNNLSSVAGAEPTAAVTRPLLQGLYAVALGDTALTNMQPIPFSVFDNADVRLRIWFSDTGASFQLLSPDQRIAAVGYAMIAATVPDGSITSSNIAAGAVGTTQLASGAVQTVNIAAGAVGSAQIGDGTVGSADIANGAVGAAQLASGAVDTADLDKPTLSGTILSSTLEFDFGHARFSDTFTPAFGTTPVVTLALQGDWPKSPPAYWVQTRSTTSFSGRVEAGRPAPVEPEPATNAGSYCSLAVVSGNPAISYYDTTNTALKFVRASNANGTSWNTPETVDNTAAVGLYTSLAVVNGNPAISYYDNSTDDLKYVRATNATGTTWGAAITVDTGGANLVGFYTSLVVVNGNPAIAYYDTTADDLKYVRASDVDGTAWGTPVVVDSGGANNVGSHASMTIVSGNPAISYYDSTADDLKFVRATNANGTAWGTPVTVDGTGLEDVGQYSSLAVVNGNPAISYHSVTTGALLFVRATNSTGSAWGTPQTLDSVGTSGWFTSLEVINGNPAISYHRKGQSLAYVRATNASGSAWGAAVVLDPGGVGEYTSLALVNGSPAISYYDFTNDRLKYIREDNASVPAFTVNWLANEP